MIELDRLLSQAEAQQTSDIWEVLNKYRREVTYVDDDGYVNIVGRKIDTIRENVSVQGEQYSQYIEFLMDRFYDGVDLAEHTIAIHYEVEGNGGEDAPINVYKNSTQLKFGWLIGPNVAQYAQPVEFCIWVRGTLINGNKYVLKTLPQIYTPKRGLVLGGGIPKPDNNWYLQFSLSMDEKVNQSALNASQAANSANEARTAEIVVLQAQQEVSQKSEVVDTQYKEIKIMHQEAEQYRDEALQFRNEAEQFTPDGYDSLVEQVNKNTVAVNTIVEKADLGMKETASGEEIYLFDSSNGKPPEFYLFGKAKQNTTSGKNKLKCKSVKSQTINGVTFTVNEDGSIHAKGTASDRVTFFVDTLEAEEINKFNGFKLSGGTGGTIFYIESTDTYTKFATNTGTDVDITIPDGNAERAAIFYRISNGVPVDDMLYPMISLDGGEYEPYTGGIPSPNPDYKQDIEVAGESYNLLENTATSQTINGVEFVVNEDKYVSLSGTPTDTTVLTLNSGLLLPSGDYILSGCPSGGGSTSNYKLDIVKNGASAFMDIGNGAQFTSDGETTLNVRIVLYSGASIEGKTFYPMIRKASVKNDRYMPYGKGSVEVKSYGKNLLDWNIFVGTHKVGAQTGIIEYKNGALTATKDIGCYYIDSGKIPFKLKAGTYTLMAKINSNSACRLTFDAYNLNGDRIVSEANIGNSQGGFSGLSYKTFIANSDIDFVEIRAVREDVVSTEKKTVVYEKIMLLQGTYTTEQPFEAYKGALSTIPTDGIAGIPVDSDGNYTDQNGQQWICDEIVKYADGSGKYVRRVGKTVLNGSENWYKSSTTLVFYTDSVKDAKLEISPMMCDMYTHTLLGNADSPDKTIKQGVSATTPQGSLIYIKDSSFETVDELKTYLAENNVTCYYILAEPIRTPLTAEEIAEIEKLSTFYPVTNISNDFDCGMKVTYVVDAKNYIDNKLAQIAAAVVNNI